MNRVRRYNNLICFVIMLGLVTVGISPACEFIAGKESTAEHCHDIAGGGDKEQKAGGGGCQFCFSLQFNKMVVATGIELTRHSEQIALPPLPLIASFPSFSKGVPEARAPPAVS